MGGKRQAMAPSVPSPAVKILQQHDLRVSPGTRHENAGPPPGGPGTKPYNNPGGGIIFPPLARASRSRAAAAAAKAQVVGREGSPSVPSALDAFFLEADPRQP